MIETPLVITIGILILKKSLIKLIDILLRIDHKEILSKKVAPIEVIMNMIVT